jgi:serine/threonine-protein phosphatase PGAM5
VILLEIGVARPFAGSWRGSPETFSIDGIYPIHEVFTRATLAWERIILHPSDVTLVVTHKSILRALICTALGLGPASFRAVDIHNAGVCIFWVNRNGEAMLQNLNLTAHLNIDHMY